MYKTIFTCLLALNLSACSNEKTANESNFKKAIQASMDSTKFGCASVQVPFHISPNFDLQGYSKSMPELVKGGIVVETPESEINADAQKLFGPGGKFFKLTEAGQKIFTADAKNANVRPGVTQGHLCISTVTVKEIVSFTQPSDAFGTTMSEIKFTYSATPPPASAQSPEVLRSFSGFIAVHKYKAMLH